VHSIGRDSRCCRRTRGKLLGLAPSNTTDYNRDGNSDPTATSTAPEAPDTGVDNNANICGGSRTGHDTPGAGGENPPIPPDVDIGKREGFR